MICAVAGFLTVSGGHGSAEKYGLIFGTSICYTSKNISTVTSDEFLDMIIDKGLPVHLVFPLHAGRK